MASIADLINPDQLGQNLQNPMAQIGLQMLARSGRPGSLNESLGQSGIGAAQALQEYQRQQALQQYRQAVMNQQQEQVRRQQEQEARAQAQRQAMQDPQFLAQLSPLARAMAQSGADPDTVLAAEGRSQMDAYRQQQLALQGRAQDRLDSRAGTSSAASPARAPTPRQIIEEPLPDGRVQKHIYDAKTGGYQPYGSPYSPYSTRGKSSAAAPGASDKAGSLVDQILGDQGAQAPSEQPAGVPLSQAGQGGLSSYAPKTGAALLTTSGSVAKGAKSTAANDPTLASALNAIQRGANPQAVRQRLLAAGYAPASLAGIGL